MLVAMKLWEQELSLPTFDTVRFITVIFHCTSAWLILFLFLLTGKFSLAADDNLWWYLWMKSVTLTEANICWSLVLSDKSSCLCCCLVVGPRNRLSTVTASSCWHSRSVWRMPLSIGFEFWLVLCGDRSWTRWFLWIPSNSEDSMLL